MAINFKSKKDAATLEEIYAEISARQVAALMLHGQMADYFDFLSLHGYKRMHEYQYYSESIERRNVSMYYINHHGKLLPDTFSGDISVIPDGWYTANRISVGKATKQKAVEDGFAAYRDWETETKEVYSHYARKLRELGNEADALFVDGLVDDVDCELKQLDRVMLDLISCGYDMVYIVESQKEMHEKYKRKEKELR
jgi:hypothetical protein